MNERTEQINKATKAIMEYFELFKDSPSKFQIFLASNLAVLYSDGVIAGINMGGECPDCRNLYNYMVEKTKREAIKESK